MRPALVVLALAAVLARQAQPARDAAGPPTLGSGSVSGLVVTDEETPRPVRRAVVTLAGGGLRPSRSAITDDDGRFTIGGLPDGRFTLTASRAAFITSAYGARRPGRPGTPIVIQSGAAVRDLAVRLWRGAVVAGAVRDVGGEPARGVPVQALAARKRPSGGLLTLSNNGALTNDRGEFRIFGLEPGSYVVVARLTSSSTPSVELAEAQMEAALARLRRQAGTPAGAQPQAAAAQAPFDPFTLAPVYYPGTTQLTQATPIVLAAGQEATGLEFSLQRLRTYEVTGVLTRPDGRMLAGTSLQLTASRAPGSFSSDDVAMFSATAGADGAFRFAAVPPGDYRLIARAPVAPLPPSQFETSVRPGFDGATLFALADVTVGSAPLTGLSVPLRPTLSLSGRVVFDGTSLAPPKNLAQLSMAIVPPELLTLGPGSSVRTLAYARPSPLRTDGTFRIDGIVPGLHGFSVMGPATAGLQWWLRSAVLDGRDLLDGYVEITADMKLSDLVVTFSDRPPELSGTLQSGDGTIASDVFVIAYAADRAHWRPGTRRVQAVRPGVDGRYTITGLPPGRYMLAALTDVDENDWQDQAFLEQLVPASVAITIGEGERKTQDLRIGRRP